MADGFRFPLNIYGQTDVGGKRQRNEDSLRFHLPKHGEAEFRLGALALVCDGMGGVGKGDIASQTAVEAIFRVYYDMDNPQTDTRARLQKAIETAQSEVQARARDFGMMYIGTTAAGMVVRPDGSSVVFNLGDSRVYRKRGDQFEVISKDQSVLAAQLERGEITPEQALASRNMNITAFIGHPMELNIVFRDIKVESGDIFLLCSDGLWDVVHDPELKAALDTRSDEAALQYYITETLKRGAPDNVTAIIVSTRPPQRAGLPTWIWGLVGLGILAIAAFAVMQNSLSTLTEGTPTLGAGSTAIAELASATVEELTSEPETPVSAANVPVETETQPPAPTEEDTEEPTVAASDTPEPVITETETTAPTETTGPTNTNTRQPTRTRTPTPGPSETPTGTATPTSTFTWTPSLTYTPSYTPSPTPTVSPTPTDTLTPTTPPTITARPSLTPRPSRTPTATPAPTNTRVRTVETIAPTSTLSISALVALGIPTESLALIEVLPLVRDETTQTMQFYAKDLIEINVQPYFPPNDPGVSLQLMRLRGGILGGGSTNTYFYRIDPIEPQIVVLNDDGIILHQFASFTSRRTGGVGKGARAKITAVSLDGKWLRIDSDTGRGWASIDLVTQGFVEIIGDINAVPKIQPPTEAINTPDPLITPSDVTPEVPPESTPPV